MSPRPPPKISLRHDWTKELGSKIDRQPQEEVARQPREEVARQPRGEVSRQAKFFQPTQRIPKPICDRSGQPDNKHEVFGDKGETSWSREIKEKSSHEELCSSDRSGQPDITPSVIRAQTNLSGEIRVEQTHDRSGQPDKHEIALRAAAEVHREITTLNTDNELTHERIEEDLDFKIPGLPHSIVKQLQSVIDSNQNSTEILADPHEDQAPQTSIKVIADRSKAKAKPQKREPVDTPSIIPMHERKWFDIEPSEPSLAAYEVSKKVISLLRHNQTVQREDDGAIQFWRIKFHLRNHSSQVQHWSDERWKSCLASGGGSKRRYQYCSDNSGTILYLRALQGHSGHNLIDPTLQDNVMIESGIFHHIYHIGCAFNLHSIINNGLIPGGQDLSRRQTVFFLPTDPRDKHHKDPEYIDFSVPRRAQYLHSA